MVKRSAAWPRGIRWLAGGIAAVVLALFFRAVCDSKPST
jgi:hypothetical protein